MTLVASIVLATAAVAAFKFWGPKSGPVAMPVRVSSSQVEAPRAETTIQRHQLGRCMEHAQLIHDVHWASACMVVAEQARARHAECLREAPGAGDARAARASCERAQPVLDDSAECTLPDARSAALYAALQAAENRCVEEARAPQRARAGG